jgi:hypothetical protein
MSVAESANAVVRRLSSESSVQQLAMHVSRLGLAAADDRDARFASGPGEPGGLKADASLTPELAETPFGNVLVILRQGAQSDAERLLLGTLLTLGIEPQLPSAPETELALAAKLVWLATHTPVDALVALDAGLGEKAGVLWQAIGRIVEDPVRVGHGMTRGEAVVALLALRASSSEAASEALRNAAGHATDPLVLALLRSKSGGVVSLTGELLPAPRGPVVTALLAVTMLLFALHAARFIGKIALSYRRPAQLRLTERGLELEQRTEMLGRVLRDRSMLVPIANLARVTREVRYSRAGMYAGLLALVLGSYVGMGFFVDGLRVPGTSPPLLGLAVLMMVLGLLLDFGLSALSGRATGKCRIVVVPRKGPTLCIAALDSERADAMLSRLAENSALNSSLMAPATGLPAALHPQASRSRSG